LIDMLQTWGGVREEALQVVQDATRAGAAGVVFGRNIWQSGDTRGMIQALRRIIHEKPATEAAFAVRHAS
jgi:DhnA family fructose-bisphosphate aldolase class Ia